MFEYAVVGSGIGGSSIAAYLDAKGKDVVLFEKEAYLGGCSSSFSYGKYTYNTGATTLAGYQDDFVVKEMFDAIGFEPKLIETNPTIVIKQNGKTTPRYKEFEKFLLVLEENYPHPRNREFWTLVYKINMDFYKYNGHYYSNKSFLKKLTSLFSFLPIAFSFQKYLRSDAYSFIDEFFDGISEEYLQFLESQILIVAQAESKEVNFLTAALSLGYTFHDNYYVLGGFSQLFNDMTKNIKQVQTNSQIIKIEKEQDYFELYTQTEKFQAQKVILNSTVYDSAKLFDNQEIKSYYKSYEKLNNYQGSFMLYMTIKTTQKFEHHYQLIEDKRFPFSISKAIFISFSDRNDNDFVQEGHYSITASIHTDLRLWENKALYKRQKKELQGLLLDTIIKELDIDESDVLQSFSATPKTFNHYINRAQQGGNAISMKNFFPFLPSNDTKIQNLYNVGDTVYAAQGWPGVMMGVKNLTRLLDV